jgi:hypothetical protein
VNQLGNGTTTSAFDSLELTYESKSFRIEDSKNLHSEESKIKKPLSCAPSGQNQNYFNPEGVQASCALQESYEVNAVPLLEKQVANHGIFVPKGHKNEVEKMKILIRNKCLQNTARKGTRGSFFQPLFLKSSIRTSTEEISWAALKEQALSVNSGTLNGIKKGSEELAEKIIFRDPALSCKTRKACTQLFTKTELSTTTRAEIFDNLSYRILGIGFPLLTIGILSGAVWANQAWGSYWSWDPKETWAFITWLVFAIYFHTRLTKGWAGKRSAFVACIGFLTVWVCYLGVNLLGKGLHSYGWWANGNSF